MNIKFEWLASKRNDKRSYCWVGGICCGHIERRTPREWAACAGDNNSSDHRSSHGPTMPTKGKAKAWVEEQARAWLKEVTA